MTFTPDELRLMSVAGPVMLRMLKSREERIVSTMYGAFRNGERDFVAAMAELACVRDQQTEIVNAIKQQENLK